MGDTGHPLVVPTPSGLLVLPPVLPPELLPKHAASDAANASKGPPLLASGFTGNGTGGRPGGCWSGAEKGRCVAATETGGNDEAAGTPCCCCRNAATDTVVAAAAAGASTPARGWQRTGDYYLLIEAWIPPVCPSCAQGPLLLLLLLLLLLVLLLLLLLLLHPPAQSQHGCTQTHLMLQRTRYQHLKPASRNSLFATFCSLRSVGVPRARCYCRCSILAFARAFGYL